MKTYLITYIVDDTTFYHFSLITGNKGQELLDEIEAAIIEDNFEEHDFTIINIIDLG
jgi:hypothetical protein